MAKFIYTLLNWQKQKFNFFFLLFFFFSINHLLASGSLITIRNYYFFEKPDLDSKRHYIARYNTFSVLDIYEDKDGKFFFLVEVNIEKKKQKKEGFIFKNSVGENEKTVQLFFKIPEKKTDLLNYQEVLFADLKFQEDTFSSKEFPLQIWYKVEYNTDPPEKAWASESAIIYRFDKSPKWLSEKFSELVKQKITKDKRNKILSGIIERGYNKEEVILTLGSPLAERMENNFLELEYKDRKIIFQEEEVKQIILKKDE